MATKLGYVKWLDASRTDEEVNPTTLRPIVRETVGWVLQDDEEGVIMAFTKDGQAFERGFFVPREYVKEFYVLRRR